MASSVARKPQGLCAPHVVQINLLGRFPGGTQSLTAETPLSLSRVRQRGKEREREEKQGQQGDDQEEEKGDGKFGEGGCWGLSLFFKDKEVSLRERQRGALWKEERV